VIVAGLTGGLIDFGGGVVGTEYRDAVFVAKFTAAGAPVFGRTFPSEAAFGSGWVISPVALDSHDNVFIAGTHESPIDFGAGTVLEESGGYVAKFDPSGQTLGAWHPAGSGAFEPRDLAFDPSDNLVLVGAFEGDLEQPVPLSAVAQDALVMKFDPQGDLVWARHVGGEYNQVATAVATDDAGNVFATGELAGPLTNNYYELSVFLTKIKP
jgi:hypothetical protein